MKIKTTDGSLVYTYNVDNKVLPLDTNNLYGYTEYVYDAMGNIISESFYDKDQASRRNFKCTYKYDSKHSVWTYLNGKEEFFANNESQAHWLSINSITKQTFISAANMEVVSYTYIYDSNGYPLKMSGNKGEIYEFEYK